MKKIISVVLSLVFVLGIFPAVGFAATNTEDIIILYENDVLDMQTMKYTATWKTLRP